MNDACRRFVCGCLLEQPVPHLECERGRSHHGVEHDEPHNEQKRNPDRRMVDSASGQLPVVFEEGPFSKVVRLFEQRPVVVRTKCHCDSSSLTMFILIRIKFDT